MSAPTEADFAYARVITGGSKHRHLPACACRLLVLNNGDGDIACHEHVNGPAAGLDAPQTAIALGHRSPEFAPEFGRVGFCGLESVHAVVNADRHNVSPSVAGSAVGPADAREATVGDATGSDGSPSGEPVAPSGGAR